MRPSPKASLRFKRSALSVALGLSLASSLAYGQSNSAGALFGQASPGEVVVIENPATGYKREIAVSESGNYRVAQLPVGTYRITLRRADGSTSVRENVGISVGTGTPLDFVAVDATMETVQVTAGGGVINAIDVSSVESSTVLTAERIAKIPVPRNITSVALLAPGTVKGDAAFGDLASFGGSSVAENQFFLNGFNITNTFKNLNFAQIPFEAIGEQQIKTGGYGAEFGRSTGGVVNLVTKRGSNEFHAGASTYWIPESLSGDMPNEVNNDGELAADNSKNKGWEWTSAVWANGALVQDKLFFYALAQFGKEQQNIYPELSDGGSNREPETKSPMWLLKMDWNINDNNLLELTAFSDTRDVNTGYYATQYDDNGVPQRGAFLGTDYAEQGGDSYAFKYTGYLSDTLTLSALAGHGEFKRNNYGITANGVRQDYNGGVGSAVSGCPIIVDARPDVISGDVDPIVGCSFVDSLGRPDAGDERDQFRIDLEWALGDHLLRGGVDIDNFESVDGESYAGGAAWRYGRYTIGGTPREDVVRKRIFQSGATVEVNQQAYYIEDSWSVTDNLVAYLGLRWDTFENKNGSGQTYAEIEDQFAPRLGVSWDVFGDSSLKVFGNAGRYALPLTANVAVRGASASLYQEEFFTFTGIDPVTGAPTGLTRILNPNNGEYIRYLNNEFGVGKDPTSITSENLEPMYQDEYILGFQKEFSSNLSGGVRATYRDLKRAIDDTCDYRPIEEWAEDNGYEFNPLNPGFAFCRFYNPGSDGIFNIDVDGDGTLENITIAADVLGPAAKRTYTAAELFFEGVWDRWFFQGSYTWSKSEGNTEGGIRSDTGQDDTGATQDFDYPELMIGADGYLPNDRRHSLKLFGNYDISEEWSAGANLTVQSGRPINCFGLLGGYDTSIYENSYFSCDPGETTGEDGGGSNGNTVVPRGSAGRMPWSKTLDLNIAYRPAYLEGFQVKLDVFNVFNSRETINVRETGEDAGGTPQPDVYKVATGWQDPRTVRLMMQYDF